MSPRALALALALVTATAVADSPENVPALVARLAPGSAEPATALSGSSDVEQLSAELDVLDTTGQTPKVFDTLQAVQRAAGAAYWAEDFDLVRALVALDRADPDAYRALLGSACILQALSRDGGAVAIGRMILVASAHGGALRVEVTRRLNALGERAVAPLLLARADARTRGFAWATLDALGKKIPGDAVQTHSNAVLSEILAAYGATHDMDALGVVMSFVGSDREEVRVAARAALLAYGELALPRVREMYANVVGHPSVEREAMNRGSANDLAHAVFAALDKQRSADLDALVEDGLARSQRGDFLEATQVFDKVLAQRPDLDRRKLLAPAYARLGFTEEDGDRPAARAAFRKALELDPEGPHAADCRGELSALDGEDLLARGVEDREPFTRALSLNPGNARARAALDRLDAAERFRVSRTRRWTWAALAGGAFVALLILFGRLPARRATRSGGARGPRSARRRRGGART